MAIVLVWKQGESYLQLPKVGLDLLKRVNRTVQGDDGHTYIYRVF